MSARTLVRLADRYPGTSRMTRYRWRRNEPDFPDPIIIAGREFYNSAELVNGRNGVAVVRPASRQPPTTTPPPKQSPSRMDPREGLLIASHMVRLPTAGV